MENIEDRVWYKSFDIITKGFMENVYCSESQIPEHMRNTYAFIYLSVLPKIYIENKMKQEHTEEEQ